MTRKRSKPHNLPLPPSFVRRGKSHSASPSGSDLLRFRDPMRSGRMPRTLINGSTGANAAAGVRAIAASMHFRRPCYAAQLQRIGRALAEGVTEAGAIAAWTEKPVPLGAVGGNTLAENALAESSAVENLWTESDWTTLGDPIV
jgi:hypothetical protein